jgi:hypothetical protein
LDNFNIIIRYNFHGFEIYSLKNKIKRKRC